MKLRKQLRRRSGIAAVGLGLNELRDAFTNNWDEPVQLPVTRRVAIAVTIDFIMWKQQNSEYHKMPDLWLNELRETFNKNQQQQSRISKSPETSWENT